MSNWKMSCKKLQQYTDTCCEHSTSCSAWLCCKDGCYSNNCGWIYYAIYRICIAVLQLFFPHHVTKNVQGTMIITEVRVVSTFSAGWPLSPIRSFSGFISCCRRGEVCVPFLGPQNYLGAFVDDVVLASSDPVLKHVLGVLQLSVKQLGWESAPPSLRPWHSAVNGGLLPFGWDWVAASSAGIQVSGGIV